MTQPACLCPAIRGNRNVSTFLSSAETAASAERYTHDRRTSATVPHVANREADDQTDAGIGMIYLDDAQLGRHWGGQPERCLAAQKTQDHKRREGNAQQSHELSLTVEPALGKRRPAVGEDCMNALPRRD